MLPSGTEESKWVEVDGSSVKDLLWFSKTGVVWRCLEIIDDETFKGGFDVLWAGLDMPLFNTRWFKYALREFVFSYSIHKHLLGFVVVACERDVRKWRTRIENAERRHDDEARTLPFHVVGHGIGKYYKVSNEHSFGRYMTFVPDNEELLKRWVFVVHSRSAWFRMRQPKIPGFFGVLTGDNSSTRMIVPDTAFVRMSKTEQLCEEYEMAEGDGNDAATHPPVVFNVNKMPDIPVDKIPRDTLYDSFDLTQASARTYMRGQRYSLSEASKRIAQISKRKSSATTRCGEPVNLSKVRREKYKRPYLLEDAEELAEFMSLQIPWKPFTLIDADAKKKQYEIDTCGHFGVPYSEFSSEIDLPGGRGADAHQVYLKKKLEKLTHKGRLAAKDAIEFAYNATFGHIDEWVIGEGKKKLKECEKRFKKEGANGSGTQRIGRGIRRTKDGRVILTRRQVAQMKDFFSNAYGESDCVLQIKFRDENKDKKEDAKNSKTESNGRKRKRADEKDLENEEDDEKNKEDKDSTRTRSKKKQKNNRKDDKQHGDESESLGGNKTTNTQR